MPKATLFNPLTKQRIAVETGSPEAQRYFGQGFKLETPTQNISTWSETPSREIAAGPDRRLYAVDNVSGTQAYIPDTRMLSDLVGTGGYQDTRRGLNLDMGTQTQSQAGNVTQQPTLNPSESFNLAIANLLKNAQSGGGDEDLIAKRNQLIQQRFNVVGETTPGSEQVLSPSAQASLRRGREAGLETSLTGVNTALQNREAQRKEWSNQLKDAMSVLDAQRKAAKDDAELQNQIRDDARVTLKNIWDTYGSAPFQDMSPDEKRKWEDKAGFPYGTLSYAGKTIKEEGLDKNRYQVVAATKYHGTLIFDKVKGTYVDNRGNPVSAPAGAPARPAGTAVGGKTGTFVKPKGYDVEIGKAVTRLKNGENWGNVWNSVKARFPNVPDSIIDSSLGVEWKQTGAYQEYKKKTAKTGTARTPLF